MRDVGSRKRFRRKFVDVSLVSKELTKRINLCFLAFLYEENKCRSVKQAYFQVFPSFLCKINCNIRSITYK